MEESSHTGTEEVNSEAEVPKDNHNIMWRTLLVQNRRPSGEGMKRNSDVTVVAARR